MAPCDPDGTSKAVSRHVHSLTLTAHILSAERPSGGKGSPILARCEALRAISESLTLQTHFAFILVCAQAVGVSLTFSDPNLLPIAYGGEQSEVIQFVAPLATNGFWFHPECSNCGKVEKTSAPGANKLQWQLNFAHTRHTQKLARHGEGICERAEEEATPTADVSPWSITFGIVCPSHLSLALRR